MKQNLRGRSSFFQLERIKTRFWTWNSPPSSPLCSYPTCAPKGLTQPSMQSFLSLPPPLSGQIPSVCLFRTMGCNATSWVFAFPRNIPQRSLTSSFHPFISLFLPFTLLLLKMSWSTVQISQKLSELSGRARNSLTCSIIEASPPGNRTLLSPYSTKFKWPNTGHPCDTSM